MRWRLIVYLMLSFFNQFLVSGAQCKYVLLITSARWSSVVDHLTFLHGDGTRHCYSLIVLIHLLRYFLGHDLVVKFSSSWLHTRHVWNNSYLTAKSFELLFMITWICEVWTHELPVCSFIKWAHIGTCFDVRIHGAWTHVERVLRHFTCVTFLLISESEIVFSKLHLFMMLHALWVEATVPLFAYPYIGHVSNKRVHKDCILDIVTEGI